MTIRRHLPDSTFTMLKALIAAKDKNDSILPANRFLTANTESRLNAMLPAFKTAMQLRANTLAAQTLSTASVDTAFEEAQILISHFFQVFNLGVRRKKYPASTRLFYSLNISGAKLPSLRREDDISHWGERIETGDAARIAIGGLPMSNPTAAEVKTAVDDFDAKNMDQSTKKDAHNAAQRAVKKLMPQARKVIKKVWDEVETFYNEESAPSRRRKAREWGLVYTSDVQLTFSFTVTDANGVHIDNASIELNETGNTVETKAGAAQMKSQVHGAATFIITHSAFPEQRIKMELPHGETEFVLGVKMQ
jgi:hypothetical protein